VGASYGVSDSVDVHAHAHLTPLLLGTVGFDAGATWLGVTEAGWRPALSLTGRGYVFSDFSTGAVFYGEAGAAASWWLGERCLTYLSTRALYDALEEDVVFAVGTGVQVPFDRFALQAEVSWYAPGYDTSASPVSWASLGGRGAFGLVLGASYRFGGGGSR
jgi:hypothetical protein